MQFCVPTSYHRRVKVLHDELQRSSSPRGMRWLESVAVTTDPINFLVAKFILIYLGGT